jgi:RHS repeat-associated protein
VINAQSYTYDAAGRISTHTDAGVTTTYTYDLAGQLASESRPGYSATYTYDGNGNRLTRTVNGVTETYAYDNGDKLQSVSVGGSAIKTFGYDAAGRTTSVVTPSGTTSLTYDYESRLTSVTGPGITASYTYNGLDTRVGKTENGASQDYKRDGVDVTDAVLSDSSAFYTPGISEKRAGVTSYLHGGLKNQTRQTNSSQTTTATRTYDAFGNVTSSSGTWNGPFGNGGAFGYQEDATGLKLLGHRYYDSSIGRFLTRDPIKDGRNWYAYCGGDPVNGADPEGLWELLRWVWTGDGNASDEVYEASLDQAWDTGKKAAVAYAKHFAERVIENGVPMVGIFGPLPKSVFRYLQHPRTKWRNPKFRGRRSNYTSGIRLAASWFERLQPLADFAKKVHKPLWAATGAITAWQATFDTWNDPSVWTFKDEEEE